MTSRDFCFWLQGFFEITDGATPSPAQVKIIQNHLNMVFVHEIDPSMGGAKHQKDLNKIHNNRPPFSHPSSDDGIVRC